MPKQRMAVIAVVFALLVSGCLGSTGLDGSMSAPDETTTDAPPAYPAPPATLNNSTVKQIALAYGEVFIKRQLRNASGLSNYYVGPATVTERAAIVNRTDRGVYVEVRHPYSYEYSEGAADFSTEALYLVNESAIERVQGQDVDLPD